MTLIQIVEDQRLFAEAIKDVLEKDGFAVAEIAATGQDAIRSAKLAPPDLVLLDLGLPDESGLVVGQRILESCPGAKIVILTALKDPKTLQSAVRRGFHGFLTKDAPIQQLLVAIKAILEGHVVIPQHLAKAATGARTREEEHADLLVSQLTERERDVLAMLVQGASSAEIAGSLGISPNTVRTHMQNLLMKLEVHSRLEAAAFAVRNGLFDPGRDPGPRPNHR